jgi:hypothetical protein
MISCCICVPADVNLPIFNFFWYHKKWHAQWDLVLLPSLLHSNGHHKFLHKLRVLALH